MEKSSIKNKIFSGMFWKFGERILAQLVSFVISIVLARMLLPNEYGIVSIVLIFITIADVFVSSGFSSALIQKKDATDEDFSTIFYCSLAVSILTYIVLYLVAPFIANFYNMPELTLVVRVFSVKLIISAYNSVQHAYVSRNMIFKRFFFSTLFGTLLSGIVGIILAYKGFGVWALVAQYFVNSIVDSLVLSFTIPWHPRLVFSKKSAKELMGFGWKVLIADLSGTFFDQLRSLIIGKIYTPADLAFYNKGKQIPSILTDNMSTTIMTVLFPAIANESDDKDKVKILARQSLRMMSFIIFPLMIGCAFIAKPLILTLLTSKWESSVIFVQILCITSAISIIGSTSLQVIKAVGRSDILLKLEFIKKPIYFALLVIGAFISVFGIAVTGFIYTAIGSLINSKAMSKVIDYKVNEQIKDIAPSLLISLIMGIFIYAITLFNFSNNMLLLVIQVLVGIVIYIVLSIIFKIPEYKKIKSFFIERMKGVK